MLTWRHDSGRNPRWKAARGLFKVVKQWPEFGGKIARKRALRRPRRRRGGGEKSEWMIVYCAQRSLCARVYTGIFDLESGSIYSFRRRRAFGVHLSFRGETRWFIGPINMRDVRTKTVIKPKLNMFLLSALPIKTYFLSVHKSPNCVWTQDSLCVFI